MSVSDFTPDTMREGADVLRAAAAHITDDTESLHLALGRYVEGLHDFPHIESFLATSLLVVESLVIELAKVRSATPEAVIDELLLELI